MCVVPDDFLERSILFKLLSIKKPKYLSNTIRNVIFKIINPRFTLINEKSFILNKVSTDCNCQTHSTSGMHYFYLKMYVEHLFTLLVKCNVDRLGY